MIGDQCSKENEFGAHFQDLQVSHSCSGTLYLPVSFYAGPVCCTALIKASMKVLSLSIKYRIRKTLFSGAAEAKWSSFKICRLKQALK